MITLAICVGFGLIAFVLDSGLITITRAINHLNITISNIFGDK